MSRRLVTVLAVRNGGVRLYGKPLQRLDASTTILAHSVEAFRSFDIVHEVVLAVAEGAENAVFTNVAAELGCPFVVGSEDDVLGRVVLAAESAGATDVLRKTSEDPFFDYDQLGPAWDRHVSGGQDVTALDHAPEGAAFEIVSLEALRRCDAEAEGSDREHVLNYIRFNQAQFRVAIAEPEPASRRPDLRLTVDTPEDLIVARAVFAELGELAPRIPLARIIAFLDSRPDLRELVAPFSDPTPVWDGVPQR
jgi:spore coat polysaccharide biosynthesis protein SpsF